MTTNTQRGPSLFSFSMLFIIWLLLTNSFTLGNALLAAVLSWGILKLVGGLVQTKSRVKHPLKAGKYVLILIYDIIVSNAVVARQVLGPVHHLRPGFIAVPLSLTEPLPITLLASTISLTPGTVSTELSKDLKTLYVHALNVDDEASVIEQIKTRYEAPLKEIFEC